jgi:hypothetical protein
VGVDHRDLDDVGRGALDRHVDRESLPWRRTCGRPERRDQAVAARGDETGADRAALLGAERDVLELGVGDPSRVIFADRSKIVIFEPIPSSSS